MTKGTRWLLVITAGVMVHLFLAIRTVAERGPYKNMPSFTSGLLPFGQVNYYAADSIVFIEWLNLLVLWIVFAVSLLREQTA